MRKPVYDARKDRALYGDWGRARIAELESAPLSEAREAAAVEPVGVLSDVPSALLSFILPDEDAVKFTERMRRRYRGLKHMQMDAARPTNARSLPDMSEEEIEDMKRLQALGAEAVAWLERD